MLGKEKEKTADIRVQGTIAIAAGVIIFAALLLPWLSGGRAAISGITQSRDKAAVAVPLTLIFLAVLTVFGGTIHCVGYKVGIRIATLSSALAFLISVLVIIATLAGADSGEGSTLNLLIGPWIGAAGAVFGALSSKLERK
ncbi:MAG: hypothetical protein WCC63_03950 [Candidatus Bathyarchaeia archaeon]